MKTPEEVKKMIDEREAKLTRLHLLVCGMDSKTLERFPSITRFIMELVNELVLLKEIYHG